MGWKPDHKRIREKYNPVMNAAEVRHKARVELEPCFGCGTWLTTAHHVLAEFPEKRWRRDHRCLLPVCYDCHGEIHNLTSEPLWLERIGKTHEQLVAKVKSLWAASERDERRAA